MRKDNRGISLIEVIAVITILAILATGSFSLYHRIGHGDTAKAAAMISVAMNKVRMKTMSRSGKQYLYLYPLEDSVYMKVSTEADPVAASLTAASGSVISDNIFLSYQIATGSEQTLGAGANLCISYERSSGIFDQDYKTIKIYGNQSVVEITCVKETGRHWVE